MPVGAIAPRAHVNGWIAAAGDGIALVEGGRLEWIARPEQRAGGTTRMNDAACDSAGRFWAGSMAYDNTPGAGSLYRVDADGTCERVLDGLTIANGLGSPDGRTLYLADPGVGRIDAYACDPASGTLSDRPTSAAPTTGRTGSAWTPTASSGPRWGGAAVLAITPDGKRVACVGVDTPQPTSCAIEPGGDRMVISTATHGLQTEAGGAPGGELWMARVPASGQPQYAWPG